MPPAKLRGKVWKPFQGFHVDDRLHILPDDIVRLEFKWPWSNGTSLIDLEPLAPIVRLAALIPPPGRHVVRYSGVISSHSSLRSQIVPNLAVVTPAVVTPEGKDKPSLPLSHYISWSELLRRTCEIDTVCSACKSPLRLIALIETDAVIKKILSAMGLPTEAPKLYPARPPRSNLAERAETG